MKNLHRMLVIAVGFLMTAGISAEALADSKVRASAYRSQHDAARTSYARHHQVRKHRGFKRSGHYSRFKYRAPARHFKRVYYPPRAHRNFHYSRHSHYPRHHRYSRYHRDINVGAVVAGLVAGVLVYEILRDDRPQREVYYEDH